MNDKKHGLGAFIEKGICKFVANWQDDDIVEIIKYEGSTSVSYKNVE